MPDGATEAEVGTIDGKTHGVTASHGIVAGFVDGEASQFQFRNAEGHQVGEAFDRRALQ